MATLTSLSVIILTLLVITPVTLATGFSNRRNLFFERFMSDVVHRSYVRGDSNKERVWVPPKQRNNNKTVGDLKQNKTERLDVHHLLGNPNEKIRKEQPRPVVTSPATKKQPNWQRKKTTHAQGLMTTPRATTLAAAPPQLGMFSPKTPRVKPQKQKGRGGRDKNDQKPNNIKRAAMTTINLEITGLGSTPTPDQGLDGEDMGSGDAVRSDLWQGSGVKGLTGPESAERVDEQTEVPVVETVTTSEQPPDETTTVTEELTTPQEVAIADETTPAEATTTVEPETTSKPAEDTTEIVETTPMQPYEEIVTSTEPATVPVDVTVSIVEEPIEKSTILIDEDTETTIKEVVIATTTPEPEPVTPTAEVLLVATTPRTTGRMSTWRVTPRLDIDAFRNMSCGRTPETAVCCKGRDDSDHCSVRIPLPRNQTGICYCDEHCLTVSDDFPLPDCCPDFLQACNVPLGIDISKLIPAVVKPAQSEGVNSGKMPILRTKARSSVSKKVKSRPLGVYKKKPLRKKHARLQKVMRAFVIDPKD